MTDTEFRNYLAAAEANGTLGRVCAVCGGDSTVNGYFCFVHYAEVVAMDAAQHATMLAKRAAERSESAKQAAQTRRERKAWENGGSVAPTIFEDGRRTDSPRPKNYGRARAIKSAYCAARGW